MTIRGQGLQQLLARLRENSDEGMRLRNRIGGVAAFVVVLFGLLVAMGQGTLVLALLAAAVFVVAVTAAATLAQQQNAWLRLRRGLGTCRVRFVRRGAVIRALAASTVRKAPGRPRRSTADDPPTREHALWPVREALAEEFPDLSAAEGHPTEPAGPAEETPGASHGGSAGRPDEADATGSDAETDPREARPVAPAPARAGRLLPALEGWIGQQARKAGLAPTTQTAPLPEHARLANRLARSRNALGVQLRRVGEPAHAAEQHRTAKALYATAGNFRGEALATNSLALALADAGDEQAALEAFEQARALLHALGDDEHEAQVIANIGVAKHRAGAAEEAARLLETALAKLEPETPAYRLVERQLRRAG